MTQFLAIVLLSIFASVAYGVIHDQITARISLEYFTIGHPPIFNTESPTLIGLVWGVIATWWFGAMLGILLAWAARIGNRPAGSARSLVRPIVILVVITAIAAILGGAIGWALAATGVIRLVDHLAVQMPKAKHTPFLIAGWMHGVSYLVGFVGGIVCVVQTWRSRTVRQGIGG